jgi:hypothetical protein
MSGTSPCSRYARSALSDLPSGLAERALRQQECADWACLCSLGRSSAVASCTNCMEQKASSTTVTTYSRANFDGEPSPRLARGHLTDLTSMLSAYNAGCAAQAASEGPDKYWFNASIAADGSSTKGGSIMTNTSYVAVLSTTTLLLTSTMGTTGSPTATGTSEGGRTWAATGRGVVFISVCVGGLLFVV